MPWEREAKNLIAERFAVSAEAVDALKESLAGVTGTLLGLTAQSDALNVCFDSAAKRANELSRSIEITTAATGSIGKLRSETASTIDQLASAVQQLALQNSELRVQLQRDLKVLGDIEAQRATTSAIYDILRQHTEVLSALTGSVSSAVAANRNGALKIEPTSIVSEPEKSISEV